MTKLSSPTFAVSAVEFRLRNGGSGSAGSAAYIQAGRALAGWARPTPEHASLVHALIHLGWANTSGARSTVKSSKSAAYEGGKDHLTVGGNAAEQVVAVLEALKKAGAPAEALATVWATFTAEA